ncbi:MAG: 16S rRNA (cytosine(1402)-N(4))-methyltransferase RsmH [Patescibacteria group bacterium]
MNRHEPVLLAEVLEALNLDKNQPKSDPSRSDKNIIDCTVGDAGHSEKILEKIGENGKLLAIDADTESILRAKQFLYKFEGQITFVRDNFVNLKKIVLENNFENVNGILMDFGWSTPQFEMRGRGFSFNNLEENLDMRYSENQENTAEHVVNNYTENELVEIFKKYGEEKLSKQIAEKIIKIRKEREIKKVGDLVEIILQVYREKLKTEKEIPWIGGIHPATKVFQALRIEVNKELEVIEKVLPQAIEILQSGGRLAVISFHSLEDGLVKHFFKSESAKKNIKIITKKPLICSREEYQKNPRARSAKLRIIEKI